MFVQHVQSVYVRIVCIVCICLYMVAHIYITIQTYTYVFVYSRIVSVQSHVGVCISFLYVRNTFVYARILYVYPSYMIVYVCIFAIYVHIRTIYVRYTSNIRAYTFVYVYFFGCLYRPSIYVRIWKKYTNLYKHCFFIRTPENGEIYRHIHAYTYTNVYACI